MNFLISGMRILTVVASACMDWGTAAEVLFHPTYRVGHQRIS